MCAENCNHVALTRLRKFNMDTQISEVLTILQEECAEVIQAISKINRFGFDGKHPKETKTNSEHLAEELGDLQCMIDLLLENQVINSGAVFRARALKREKLRKWSAIEVV